MFFYINIYIQFQILTRIRNLEFRILTDPDPQHCVPWKLLKLLQIYTSFCVTKTNFPNRLTIEICWLMMLNIVCRASSLDWAQYFPLPMTNLGFLFPVWWRGQYGGQNNSSGLKPRAKPGRG
jgi:hypothetical protein